MGGPGIKTGGRVKGIPNKKTQTLLAKCEAKGIDVFEALLELAMDEEKSIRFAALKEVAQYLYAKRKSIEHSGSIDPKMIEAAEELQLMNKEDQIQLLEEELKKLKGV